jgi:crossover junction endodeoxyribonuclease RuvC
VLGIDPGLVATGYGCLERTAAGITVVAAGVIGTVGSAPLADRLLELHMGLSELLAKHDPTAVVVEDLYTEYRFPRTAILMGHARGVIYVAAAQRGLPVLALAPAEVKRVLAGNGAAAKPQVQRGVQAVLGLADLPSPSHVADALGLAFIALSRSAARRT